MANNAAITDGRNRTGHLPAVLDGDSKPPALRGLVNLSGPAGPGRCRPCAGPGHGMRCMRAGHSLQPRRPSSWNCRHANHTSQSAFERSLDRAGEREHTMSGVLFGANAGERTAAKNKTEGQAEPWVHQRRGGHVRGAGGDGDTYEAEGGGEGGGSSSSVAVIRCARAAHQGSTGGRARAEPTRDKPVRRRVCAAWRRGCPEREEAASAQKSDAAPPTLVTLVGRKRVRARCTGECRPQHDKGAQIVWKRDVPALPGRRPGAGRHAA